MGKYFGTDGFRGKAGDTLTAEHAFSIGRFLGWYYKELLGGDVKTTRAVIGKDTRESSYMLEYALAAGFTASGADVYLLHVTTTPSVIYAVKRQGFDVGVMISASHNVYSDNGIKIIDRSGDKAGDAFTSLIESFLDKRLRFNGVYYGGTLPTKCKERVGRVYDYEAGKQDYLTYLRSGALLDFKGKTVVLDLANGGAYKLGKELFSSLNANVVSVGDSPNGQNINQNVGSTSTETLMKAVKKNKAFLGFAFDGDADRCIAVDEKGNVVDGDKILYLLARNDKEKGKDVPLVVSTVMSNLGLKRALYEIGIGYESCPVGDRFVAKKMKETGATIGGENSGHILTEDAASGGDGLKTALMVSSVVLSENKPLSELVSPVVLFPQTTVNVPVVDKEIALTHPAVLETVREAEKKIGDKGRVLVRASGTEPVIRVMVECESTALLSETLKSVVKAVRSASGA